MGVSCAVCTSLVESRVEVSVLVAVGASESAEPEFESLMQHCMTWTQFFFICCFFFLVSLGVFRTSDVQTGLPRSCKR